MAAVTQWPISTKVHHDFASFCKVEGNSRMRGIEAKTSAIHMGFPMYCVDIGKCKDLGKWRARARVVRIPGGAVDSTRNVADVVRLMALKSMALRQYGEPLCAGLRSKDAFLADEAITFLEE